MNPSWWVLNIGVTNHMTGARDVFSELDVGVCSIVGFGDGSVVCIEGWNTVIFSYKSSEHHSSDIYYIPELKTNILSVGKLDECEYEILIHSSLMSIRDAKSRLVAKIPHAPNRLYVLITNIAQPVCYLARTKEVDLMALSCTARTSRVPGIEEDGQAAVGARAAQDRVDQSVVQQVPGRQAPAHAVPRADRVQIQRRA
jgi:hypothetical protein